jgi:hypothetical protein
VSTMSKSTVNLDARLLFGSHETSPIIWIGKPAIHYELRVER